MFTGQPFRRIAKDCIAVNLSSEQRQLIRDLPSELVKQLDSGDADGSVYRLFPPGYNADLGRQMEYDRLMRDDLQEAHIAALRSLEGTADLDEINDAELHSWTRAINQLRLVLGTRIGITDDFFDHDLDRDDPRFGPLAVYEFLSELQEAAVWALRHDD